ncbi:MarR family winged helix-turn-helix transcriptional regulator [Lampropedia aestuarii]|uniref:MarR family winged helix-turn-helix transcriptional regulator n=1 Tax=Lampropedia aestuarii TaxID=2562762 RepID=UPI00246855DC|nr:MarR family transcriptional regulator [Lampropedia aestuarii]MDH5858565.1 MarR family transcriptional regulator [Lampropedia aestuarii]
MAHTSEPNSAKRQIGFQLVGAGRRWRQTLDARLAQQGLSDAVWTSLIHLHRLGDGISQSELAASVGIEGSSLVRLLDTLVAQELVERHPHATDRRIKQLYLTEAGRSTVDKIRLHLERIENALLADLDEQEAAALLRGLEKINQRIQGTNTQVAE